MSQTLLRLPAFGDGEAMSGRDRGEDGGLDGSAGHLSLERRLELCEGVIDICAALFEVSGRELRQAGRSTSGVSRVRQIAMYLAHTQLGVKMAEVGRVFGRDRTTVLHACHLIEDMRDDEEFDRILSTAERITRAAFRASETVR